MGLTYTKMYSLPRAAGGCGWGWGMKETANEYRFLLGVMNIF